MLSSLSIKRSIFSSIKRKIIPLVFLKYSLKLQLFVKMSINNYIILIDIFFKLLEVGKFTFTLLVN
jgi:hypothetical protein